MHVWRTNPNVICWVSPCPWPKPTFPGVTLAGQHDQFVCGCILSFACKLDSHLSWLNHVKPLVGCLILKHLLFSMHITPNKTHKFVDDLFSY